MTHMNTNVLVPQKYGTHFQPIKRSPLKQPRGNDFKNTGTILVVHTIASSLILDEKEHRPTIYFLLFACLQSSYNIGASE